jgi:hypothetical protein
MTKQAPERFKDPVGTNPFSLMQFVAFAVGFGLLYYVEHAGFVAPPTPGQIRTIVPDLPPLGDNFYFFFYPTVAGFACTLIWTLVFEFRNWHSNLIVK